MLVGAVVAVTLGLGQAATAVEANQLDSATSTLEDSIGQWIPWFSTSLSQSTEAANSGTHSLRVDITHDWGWGVHFANWPGFPATAGATSIGFSALLGQGTMGATMWVDWFDSGRNRLRLDSLEIPSLAATWTTATKQVIAPAGTAFVEVQITNSPGLEGDWLYLDDIEVTPITNTLDYDTSFIEVSTGHWKPWFNTAIAQSAAQAHSDANSLEVIVTAPFWGVELDNTPGFAAAPGPKAISFWALLGSGTVDVTMTVNWYDAGPALLGSDAVSIVGLSGTWQQALASVTAPPGTATALVTFSNAVGGTGDTFYLDEILVLDA